MVRLQGGVSFFCFEDGQLTEVLCAEGLFHPPLSPNPYQSGGKVNSKYDTLEWFGPRTKESLYEGH